MLSLTLFKIVTAFLVSNFVAMATGVSRGRISVAWPRKPIRYTQRSRRYVLYKLSYCWFFINFFCHGNRVGHSRIFLTSFSSQTPKTPFSVQGSPRYLLHKPSCSQFCLKSCCHGNRGHPGVNLNDAVQLAICHISYWYPIGTESLSSTVFEIFGLQNPCA